MTDIIVADTAKLPAYLRAAQNAPKNDDLSSGVSMGFPIISYKGKVWHVVEGGVRELVADPDTGDPKASLEVIIVKANRNLSKVYYPSGYEEGSTEKPTCYSNNGVGPAPDAVKPQSAKCVTCPNNQWGSRVTENGSKGKACSDSRRLAVVPVYAQDKPMLLRVPAATLKELVAYSEQLTRKGVPYYAVVTRITFDHEVAHPKFKFKAVRFLTDTEYAAITEMAETDLVATIIDASENTVSPAPEPDAIEGTPPAGTPAAAAKAEKPKAEKAKAEKTKPAPEPEPEPAPVKAEEDEDDLLLAEAEKTLDDILADLDD